MGDSSLVIMNHQPGSEYTESFPPPLIPLDDWSSSVLSSRISELCEKISSCSTLLQIPKSTLGDMAPLRRWYQSVSIMRPLIEEFIDISHKLLSDLPPLICDPRICVSFKDVCNSRGSDLFSSLLINTQCIESVIQMSDSYQSLYQSIVAKAQQGCPNWLDLGQSLPSGEKKSAILRSDVRVLHLFHVTDALETPINRCLTLNSFENVKDLGCHHMLPVYQAVTQSGRRVIIRTTPSAWPSSLKASLRCTSLQHPGLVPLLDIFEDCEHDGSSQPGRPTLLFLVYADPGVTLSTWCSKRRTAIQLGLVMRDVLLSLLSLHSQGVVYGSLHESAIFVSTEGRGVLLDYGITPSASLSSSAPEVLGALMSPLSDPTNSLIQISPIADSYSVGIVFKNAYELAHCDSSQPGSSTLQAVLQGLVREDPETRFSIQGALDCLEYIVHIAQSNSISMQAPSVWRDMRRCMQLHSVYVSGIPIFADTTAQWRDHGAVKAFQVEVPGVLAQYSSKVSADFESRPVSPIIIGSGDPPPMQNRVIAFIPLPENILCFLWRGVLSLVNTEAALDRMVNLYRDPRDAASPVVGALYIRGKSRRVALRDTLLFAVLIMRA